MADRRRFEQEVHVSDSAANPLGPLLDRVPQALRGSKAYHVPKPSHVVAKLDANEFPYPMPAELQTQLAQTLQHVALERYPDANLSALRAHLAQQVGLREDRFVFGNGSDELISMLVNAFAAPRLHANPDGTTTTRPAAICYPVPTFVYYQLAAVARGIDVVEVSLSASFELNETAMIDAIERERPSVVFLALPNNPTGTMWRMQFAIEVATRFRDVLVISDEAYGDYSGMSLIGELGDHPNLIVMRTLSKVGMAGLRLGYLIAQPAVAAVLEKVRPPYNISSLDQAAALFCLQHAGTWQKQQVKEIIAERAKLSNALSALRGVTVFASEANLIMIRLASDATAVWQALATRGIMIRNFDGASAALRGCLRITVGTPAENRLLVEALSDLRR
jgi:histidinol-phosphate aminotransferase